MNPYRSGAPLSGWTVPRPISKRLKETSAPAVLPVTLDELKAHLRVTNSDEDAYLTTILGAAVTMAENYLSRGLINRNVRMYMDYLPGFGRDFWAWGSGAMQLPVAYATESVFRMFDLMRVPVAAVSQVVFVAEDDSEEVFAPTSYIADVDDPDQPARIILRRGAVWPVNIRVAKSIYCDYTVGYGTTAASVPLPLRQGVLLIAAALWSNRGDNSDPQPDILQLPAVKATLEPYRVMRFSTL